MSNKAKMLFVFLLLAATAMAPTAASSTISQQQFETGTSGFVLEIGKSWQALAILAIMISAILAAIAYAVGIGFEMPELRAWAGSELSQVVANAVIILVLLAAIVFLDIFIAAMVTQSNLIICTPGDSCLQSVTNLYLEDYVSAANSTAVGVLKNNIKAAAAANRRFGGQANTIWLLQAGYSFTRAAQRVLDQDYYVIIFEYCTNLLSFMEAQKFFVSEICFKMAPVVLAMGIVGRAFFLTRKIGGLLMAVAIGAMFFFPGMYVFDWVSLDMALNADKLYDTDSSACPPECQASAPMAYYYYTPGTSGGTGGTKLGLINTSQDIAAAFSDTDSAAATSVLRGTAARATGSAGETTNGKYIYSCYYGDFAKCPSACRELPYPGTIPVCAGVENQTYCAQLPLQCKVIRYVPADNIDQPEYAKCPASCRVVPPLKSDCRYAASANGITPKTTFGNCLSSRFDCRMGNKSELTLYGKLTQRPVLPAGTSDPTCTAYAKDCVGSATAEQSCIYVMPEISRCDTLSGCARCPAYCRLMGWPAGTTSSSPGWSSVPASCKSGSTLSSECTITMANLPDACKNSYGSDLSDDCKTCRDTYDSCTVSMLAINGLKTAATAAGNCGGCDAEKMLVGTSLPEDYTSTGCSFDNCPADYRMTIPLSSCDSCVFTEESYIYSPPVNAHCTDLCAPSDNVPMAKSGDYMKIGASGLVGKPEIQDVAKLMLPVYILPLFNIVATLVFIKALSGFLGGDIEIPGLSKVF